MKHNFLIYLFLICFGLQAQQKGAKPILATRDSRLATQSTYAVVVGISDYQEKEIPDLRYADKDAEAFANFLRSNAGGRLDNDHLKVLLNKDATAAQFAIALDWLMEVAKENDQVILYFSGHGDVEKKTITQPGYLLCWDAPSRVYLAGGALALPMFQDIITTLSSQNKAKVVVITDACRSGKLAGSTVGGSQITGANLAKQYANEIKILSCQPHEYSIEGEQWGGGRGAFSYNLVNALYGLADNNNDLIVNLQEVGRYLEDHVTTEVAPVSQVPMILGNRSETLAQVDASLLASLKSGKLSQQTLLSVIDTRGMEEEVLAAVDTSVRLTYQLFKQALKDKIFLEPANACADTYYEQLIKEPKFQRLHSTITRNYAAALQDEAQQTLNKWLKSSDQTPLVANSGKRLPQKTFSDRIKSYPRCLERAAELLGRNHYMYSILKAREYFFDGFILANSNKNPNTELGKQALSLFRKSLEWQAEQPQVYWQMSLVYGYNFNQPDSLEYYTWKALKAYPNWTLPCINANYWLSVQHKSQERAKPFLEEANRIDSNSVLVLQGRAVFYYGEKRYEEMERLLKKTLLLDSTDLVALNDLGFLYNNTERYVEAEKMIKMSISIDSTISEAWSNLGITYIQTRRFLEAEVVCKKAIALDSTKPSGWIGLGTIYNITGRYAESEPVLRKAIALDSTIKNSWLAFGNLYVRTRRFSEAEPYLQKAIALDSTYYWAWLSLGYVYLNTNRYDEAINVFKKVIELDSTGIAGWNNLGAAYSMSRRYSDAEPIMKKVIMLDSTISTFWNNLGELYTNTNRFAEAEAVLTKAIKLDSTNSQAWNNLGSLFNNTKRYSEAEPVLKKVISLDSMNNSAWNNLGYNYNSTRRFNEAVPILEKAINLNPRNKFAWSNLGLAYLNNFRYSDAEEALKKAIALDSLYSNPYKHLGMVCFKTNRIEEARKYFIKSNSLNPNYAGAMLGLAYLLQSEGKTEEAFNYVEQAISKGSTYEQLEQDEDLKSLRSDPKWNELMKKYFPDKVSK